MILHFWPFFLPRRRRLLVFSVNENSFSGEFPFDCLISLNLSIFDQSLCMKIFESKYFPRNQINLFVNSAQILFIFLRFLQIISNLRFIVNQAIDFYRSFSQTNERKIVASKARSERPESNAMEESEKNSPISLSDFTVFNVIIIINFKFLVDQNVVHPFLSFDEEKTFLRKILFFFYREWNAFDLWNSNMKRLRRGGKRRSQERKKV